MEEATQDPLLEGAFRSRIDRTLEPLEASIEVGFEFRGDVLLGPALAHVPSAEFPGQVSPYLLGVALPGPEDPSQSQTAEADPECPEGPGLEPVFDRVVHVEIIECLRGI